MPDNVETMVAECREAYTALADTAQALAGDGVDRANITAAMIQLLRELVRESDQPDRTLEEAVQALQLP
jgi:hypothetical protein